MVLSVIQDPKVKPAVKIATLESFLAVCLYSTVLHPFKAYLYGRNSISNKSRPTRSGILLRSFSPSSPHSLTDSMRSPLKQEGRSTRISKKFKERSRTFGRRSKGTLGKLTAFVRR